MEDVQEYSNSVNEAFGADAMAENIMSRMMESKEAVVAPISTIGTLLAIKAGSTLIGKLAGTAKGVAENAVKNASQQIQNKAGQIANNIKSSIQEKAGITTETNEEGEDMEPELPEAGTDIEMQEINIPEVNFDDPSTLLPLSQETSLTGEITEAGGFTEPMAQAGATSNIIGRILQPQTVEQTAGVGAEAPEQVGTVSEAIGSAGESLVGAGTEAVGAISGIASQTVSSLTGAVGGAITEGTGAVSGAIGGAITEGVDAVGAGIGGAIGGALSALGPIGLIAGLGALIPMFMQMGHHSSPPLLNPSTQFI